MHPATPRADSKFCEHILSRKSNCVKISVFLAPQPVSTCYEKACKPAECHPFKLLDVLANIQRNDASILYPFG